MINERIDALRKRERVCWDMSEVFLHARDAHGLHDMGVEIQGIQWALRELDAITESQSKSPCANSCTIISAGILTTGPTMRLGFKERQITADNWLFIAIMGVITLAAYLNATKPKITEQERKEMEEEWWG